MSWLIDKIKMWFIYRDFVRQGFQKEDAKQIAKNVIEINKAHKREK